VGKAVWGLLFSWSLGIVEEGVCGRDCWGLGFCKVSTIGCLVGDECEGGRSSLVTVQERMGGEGEG
jgi:hypothetical protein